ncbi:hypothetical protein PILCRDRAFT_11985 [Piloderma croceum F 1598]|uniref:DUF6532 domain-containing protein n=1 Tax=Piloderma croceum (strain F 1598) TaxID=765440 RepID=A0A0C3EYH4_PILCF|nr:hypothetical protein PILCRDRAFT_11985 [Piloderma croceum F 1598]
MGKRSTNQAPRNIDLDQHDGLMLESRTRTDHGLSERQKLIDQQTKIKQLEKQLGKAKRDFQSDARPPPPQKGHDDDDDSDGYETEERDPEVNSGVFPSALKSLGEVNASPIRLHKAGSSKRPPLREVDKLFNQPVIERGRSRHRTPTPEHDHGGSNRDRSDTPLSFPSSLASRHTSRRRSPLPSLSWRSLPPFSSSPPPAGSDSRKCTHSCSPSNAPPRKLPEQPNRRQPSTAQQRGTAQPGTTTEQPGAAPPPLERKPLRWLNDQAPTERPKAHDYDYDICQLIIKSCHEFSAHVCTQEALPEPKMQINWSREIWEAACKVVDENYECSDRVIGLAKGTIAACNKKICENLLENNTFHYKDPSELLGFCSNKIISEAIQAAWFSHKKAMGVEYSDYFNPLSLVTLALTLTAAKWSTGMFIKAEFNEKDNADRYKAHLTDLTKWRNGNPKVIDNICKKLFNRAYRNAGAVAIEATSRITNEAQLCAQQELEGRTGETDSEADEDDA